MEEILKIITEYGLETVIIALLVNLLTGLSKLPIKAAAKRLKNSESVTRFIVFMPIVYGFLLTFLYAEFILGTFRFDKGFATLWLTSSSLSLTFYAIFEKLFPAKKKALSDEEAKESKEIIEGVKDALLTAEDKNGKIILRGKSDEKTEAETEKK